MTLSIDRPRLSSWLRALVLATAAIVLSWPLTVATGVVAAAVSAFVATLLADAMSRSSLRLGGVLGLAAALFTVGWLMVGWLVASDLAAILGPLATLWISEALRWMWLVAPTLFALRFAARRRPLLAVFEVLVVGMAFASSLAAHRQGMLHRPLTFGDWAWSRGFDPAVIFLALGGLATLLLAAMLIAEERKKRLPLHLGALVVVALVLLLLVRVNGLPKPQPSGDLGLTGDPEAEQRDEAGRGRGNGSPRDGRGDDQLGDLEFRDEYSSAGGQAPVAVVLLHDDFSSPSGVYYFRQSVFSQYNGRRLVQATRDDVDRDIVHHFPSQALAVPEVPPMAGGRRELNTTMGLLVDHLKPFALDSPVIFQPVSNPNPLRFQRAFAALSRVSDLSYDEMLGNQPGNAAWNDEQWRHYTEAPRDPRYAALASEMVALLRDDYRDDPLAQALVIKSYLDEKGIYSRRSRHADSGDPTASFLFGDLTGYCVHFAHAATYLMRGLGLPARVAAGYAVAESDRAGGSAIMIRGANAHAWPELYLDGIGWVVVDLTPAQSNDDNMTPPDQALQRMLGEMMRQRGQEPIEAEMGRLLTVAEVLSWFVKALLVAMVIALLIKLYRGLLPRFAAARQLYRVAYRAALDSLAEVGLSRRFGESRERFAVRSAPLSPTFVHLTQVHLRSAFAVRQPTDFQSLRRSAAEVRREIARAVPFWRRLVGWLNPFSWIRAR